MKSKKAKSKLLIVIILSALAVVIAVSIFLAINLKNIKNNPEALSQKEMQIILSQVGKLIILPEGEVPVIATVTDLSKLEGQQFFANAKVGDKVLIYNESKTAILYDPIANKIIDLAPIIANASQTGSSATK